MKPRGGETVLVTGATGFTGGHLARSLAASGYRVRALVRSVERARDLTTSGVEIVPGDLTVPASMDRALEGVAVVFNIAAVYREAGLPGSVYTAVNAEAVGSLIRAASRAGVRRVVQCSTVGVHGDVEHPPANEDAPLRPGDAYQESKLEGERLARETARATGTDVVIARRAGSTGPATGGCSSCFAGSPGGAS